jgi:5'-3' exonuclease
LTGETGDNIPGIKGVGTVTARKFYHNEIAAEKPVYRIITSWLEDPLGYPRSYALWSLDLECIPKEPNYMGVNGTKNAEMAHNALDNIEASKLISQRIWDKLWS